MKVITFTFCCGNLCKSKFMAVERPGKLRIFFSYFVATLGRYKKLFYLHMITAYNSYNISVLGQFSWLQG